MDTLSHTHMHTRVRALSPFLHYKQSTKIYNAKFKALTDT